MFVTKVNKPGQRLDSDCESASHNPHLKKSCLVREKMSSKAASSPASHSQQSAGVSSSSGGGASVRADSKDRQQKDKVVSKDREDDLPDASFFNHFDTNNDLSNAA